jgi:phosphatidylethanolamine/phosphatidyl-N-methylethanolamine N-methyltransferase
MYLEIKNRLLNLRFQAVKREPPLGAAMSPARRVHAPAPGALFLRELTSDPKSIGAICSSSKRLGARMARHIELQKAGCVVELGGGTGTITQALLMHGVSANQLIVVEKSRALAMHLCRRFPKVKVIHGDAADLETILKGSPPVKAIVSGLPLRSLSKSAVIDITAACLKILHPDGRLIQFTYAPGGNSPWQLAGLKKLDSETVWTNIPPARIDVFGAAACANPGLDS